MKRYLFLILIIICFTTDIQARYSDVRRQFIVDSLTQELSKARSYDDSVRLLYDLFDLRIRSRKGGEGMMLLDLAERHGDEKVQFDISRRLASSLASSDSTLCDELRRRVMKRPDSRDRNATDLFIELVDMRSRAISADEKTRQRRLRQYIEQYRGMHNLTPREQVKMLFVLCYHMDMTAPSETLTKYLSDLGEAIEKLPFSLLGLENMYYLDAAMAYSNFGDTRKAVEMGRRLLEVLDKLSAQSKAEGRKYRNYAPHYYNTYRRLLSNYESLTAKEIDEYYAKSKQLAEVSFECNSDFYNRELSTIFYLMAKKRYKEVIPILDRQIDNEHNASFRRRLYAMMLKASRAVNDRDAMLKASLGYNDMLETYISESSASRAREFQSLYNVYSLEADNTRLEKLNMQNIAERRHMQMMTLIIATILLVLVLTLITILYYRARRLSKSLSSANSQLTEERDNLQRIQRELIEARDRARRADSHKTDFIHNMSHEVTTPLNAIVEYSRLIVDNMPEEKRKYIEKYARIVELSADMLRTLVNDVLEIASFENDVAQISRVNISANLLCEVAVECVKRYKPEGVTLTFVDAGSPEISIYTDSKRVEQVLINLLTNALKFTEKGFVELSLSSDIASQTVTFTVTDSGCGIPEGKEEKIFERFEKLDISTQGFGLGLNICRMIADMLGGKVYLDTTYEGEGSRFVFTIPM